MTHSVDATTLSQKVPSGGAALKRRGKIDITGYTASGEAPDAGKFAMGRIDHATMLETVTDNGWALSWDADNDKILAKRNFGRKTITLLDLKGGIFASQTGADQAATHVNGAFVMALADANATTSGSLAHADGKSTGLTNPRTSGAPHGRSVTVVQASVGGAVTWTAANIIVTGTDQFGNTITETIALVTGAIADTKFRWTIGTKIFVTVTNVRLSAAQPANSQISIGLGTLLGLPDPISGESDIIEVLKNAATVAAATYVGGSTAHSLDPGADLADNDDITITFNPTGQAPSGTDVGACWVEVEGR